MHVKAVDHIEDVNQVPEPDGSGGFALRTVVTTMKAGDVYDLAEDQANRLIKANLVSTDMNAPLLPHLIPQDGKA